MFGTEPKLHKYVRASLEQGDYTDIDTSELLGNDDTQKHQSLIGSLQWDIYFCSFDICTPVMTMPSFRYAPRQGNMDQVNRIYAYMDNISNA